ncbi:type_I_sec_TolC, type I secretion outer membrane protein, TolC family [Paracoccaceae bacterium]
MSRSRQLAWHGMPKKSATAAYAATLILSVMLGCTSTTEHQNVAEQRVGQLLSTSPEDDAKLDGLEFASRKELLSELHDAVLRDPRTHASLAEIAASEAEIESAASNLRPSLSGSGQIGGQSGTSSDDIFGLGLVLQAEQVIADGGARNSEIDAATGALIVASARLEQLKNALALEALEAVVAVWRLDALIQNSQLSVARLEVLQGQLALAIASGLVESDTKERLARTAIAAEVNAVRLKSERAAAEANFRRAFERAPGEIKFPPSLLDDSLRDELLGGQPLSPTLRAAAAEVVVAEATERRARAAFSPQVAMQATARSPMDPEDGPTIGVGLELRYSFFEGGKRKSQLSAALARRKAAEAQLRAAQSETRASVAAQRAALRAGLSVLELSKASELRVKEELRVAELRDAAGDKDIAAKVELEMSAHSAAEQVIEDRAALYLLEARLAAELGLLSRAIMLETASSKGHPAKEVVSGQ